MTSALYDYGRSLDHRPCIASPMLVKTIDSKNTGLNLRDIVHRNLRSVEQQLTQQISNNLLDIPSVLETIEMLIQCVVLLDSFETVSENVMRCLMQAYDLLLRNINDIRANNDQAQLNNAWHWFSWASFKGTSI